MLWSDLKILARGIYHIVFIMTLNHNYNLE